MARRWGLRDTGGTARNQLDPDLRNTCWFSVRKRGWKLAQSRVPKRTVCLPDFGGILRPQVVDQFMLNIAAYEDLRVLLYTCSYWSLSAAGEVLPARPMRGEETNRKFLCAVPIGRCWRGPSGEANERGGEKRKENKSSSLRLHISPGGRKARYDKNNRKSPKYHICTSKRHKKLY